MKLFVIILSLLISANTLAAIQVPSRDLKECTPSQAPWSFPTTQKKSITTICRKAYVLEHDNNAKIPSWVSYVLHPKNAVGCFARTNNFTEDRSIATRSRALKSDYTGSGYDMGHMAPENDMAWDELVELESFILSNISPQLPGFNRGIWKLLETSIRSWAYSKNQPLTIYTGSIYTDSKKTIGNKVVVPTYFYKVVINNTTNEVLAFLFPHSEGLGNNLSLYQVDVNTIERAAKIHLPMTADKKVISTIWPTDFKGLIEAKRIQCKGK